MRLIWHPDAIRNLVRIRVHIANDNPKAALRVAARLRSGVDTLKLHPGLGRPGRMPETREFIFGDLPYIAVYRVDKERSTVEILRVFHTSQLYPPDS